jgi:membrane-associated phospholipid phosphatase
MDEGFAQKVGDVSRGDPGLAASFWTKELTFPAAFVMLGLAAFWIDLPVARFFRAGHLPGAIAEFLENCEPFGHAYGVLLISMAVACLDPKGVSRALWLLAGGLGGGLSSNLLKGFVYRVRPRGQDLSVEHVWGTFVNWGWSLEHPHGSPSFPSSHTATAAGLAMMLATFYPRGSKFFALMTALVAAQRIASSSHFPSDVLFGAAVGWLVGWGISRLAVRSASSASNRPAVS